MIEIEIAHHSGFCFGVKEAIVKATEAAAHSTLPTKSYGPLIHNPQEIKRLQDQYGIEKVESFDEFFDGNLVIRAHGVPPEEYEKAKGNNLNVIDATCRFVVDVQEYAIEFCKRGYHLIVVGEKHHAEVKGIVGHALHACPDAEVSVIENLNDLLELNPEKAGIVFQTTQEYSKFKRFEQHLKESQKKNWKIKNTICGATKSNQYSADELARRVDLMLVIGGRNSGNTQRLAEICQKYTRTYYIETRDELIPDWFNSVTKVGITAGASTPQWLIDEVVEQVQTFGSSGDRSL
ncbi:MAG: 4-hydroxy-3-methylbut-2-enyl diphosphate reductase [Nitrospirae bacterium]|nr:4-hydroxy-3-methylbut-2-enyl diphosphate reductase [Nitrospirota bacterium]MBI3594702.1 4-hydroxy-3-methylbut-2-enyl diphosphate reductase [Nitrospirota bacterium]